MRKLVLVAATLLVAGAASADTASDRFGNRVTQFHQYRTPFLTPDLDGDGVPDTVYLVTIGKGTPRATIAADVKVIGDLFLSQTLGNAAENMAIGIVLGKSGRKFLLTGYRGDEYEDYFDAVWWNEKAAPLRAVVRGSDEFRKCQARYKFLKTDYLSMRGGEAYEDFVWWNGNTFKPAGFSPKNQPCAKFPPVH